MSVNNEDVNNDATASIDNPEDAEREYNKITIIPQASRLATDDMLADKSRRHYNQCYEEFVKWQNIHGITSVSEETLIDYFQGLSTRFAPSSLWSKYSMLKSTIMLNRNINIGRYSLLSDFLKKNGKGYIAVQSKTLEARDVTRFLKEAPDDRYLAIKVALIFGIAGACRPREIRNITVNDIEHHNNMIVVKIPRTRNDVARKFTIDGEFYKYVTKYESLRPKNTNTTQFFLCLRDGKCTQQVIGINSFGAMPKIIAEYLGLDEPELYTGRSFRRTSAKVLSDVTDGADIGTLRRHGGWRRNRLVSKRNNWNRVRETEPEQINVQQNNDCDSGENSNDSSEDSNRIDGMLDKPSHSKAMDVSNLTEINFDPTWDVFGVETSALEIINDPQRPDRVYPARRKTNADNGGSTDNVAGKRMRLEPSVDGSHQVWVKEEHGIDICDDVLGPSVNPMPDAPNCDSTIDHSIWTIKAARKEHELKLRILNAELDRAELLKQAAKNELSRSETKKKWTEAEAEQYHSRLKMSGQSGSGAGQGSGSAGAIRSAGGSFGKMEQAHEDQYFYNKQKEQLEHLRDELHDEISFHEEQIKRHQEAIARHKERIGKMPSQ